MCSEMLDAIIITGRSVCGASHIRTGKICQDYHMITRTPDYAIISVADGHGSSSCPYSDEGAKIATDVFCEFMKSYYLGNVAEGLRALISQESEIKIPQKIENEWKRRVLDQHKKVDSGTSDDDEIFKLYGTTLLGLLLTKDFAFAFQLGDGDITCVDSDVVAPVTEAEKILGVETHSLSSCDAWKHSAVAIKNICNEQTFLYILSTDGMFNSYSSREEFYKACRDYYDIFTNEGAAYINKNLTDWLNEVTAQGSGDDVTAIFAYHSL